MYKPKYDRDTIEQYKHNNGCLYVVQLSGNGETFVKVGITQFDVRTRRPGKDGKYNVLRSTEFHMGIYDAFFVEEAFLNGNQEERFYPKKNFSGITECFSTTYEQALHRVRTIAKTQGVQYG